MEYNMLGYLIVIVLMMYIYHKNRKEERNEDN